MRCFQLINKMMLVFHKKNLSFIFIKKPSFSKKQHNYLIIHKKNEQT